LGVNGREVMQKRFRDDTLALTLPIPLYRRMEEEANDCVFQIPSWKRLVEHRARRNLNQNPNFEMASKQLA